MKMTDLFEFRRPQAHEALLRLQQAGYTSIGNGFDSLLYKKNSPYMLKLISVDDRAFRDYIKLCMSNQDVIHFPKFFGKLIKVSDEYFAIRTEILQACSLSRNEVQIIGTYLYYQNKNVPDNEYKQAQAWMAEHETLKKACDIIITTLMPKYEEDIMNKTIMMRNNTVVLFSPIK